MSALNRIGTGTHEPQSLRDEIEALRKERDELYSAVENLMNVKGRYNTEIAYKRLEDVFAKVKERK